MYAILFQRFIAQVFTFLGIMRDTAATQYFLSDDIVLFVLVFRSACNITQFTMTVSGAVLHPGHKNSCLQE
jgi:hypothetical protein